MSESKPPKKPADDPYAERRKLTFEQAEGVDRLN
jgi:hypothetical protein